MSLRKKISGFAAFVVFVSLALMSFNVAFSETINPSDAIIYGDVNGNGSADSVDFGFMRKFLLGIIQEMPAANWQVSGDLNGDKNINAIDFAILRKYLLGMIPSLPAFDPVVTNTPIVTSTPVITNTPDVTNTPTVTNTPEVTNTPVITNTPDVTNTPVVTSIKSGETWYDNNGDPVNAHGGGIWFENGKYYLYGEYCSTGSDIFTAMAMYSSTDLMNWTFERKILTVQESGELGPDRIGQRPHILKCPSTGEYVMFIHAADKTYQVDKEIVYATCSTINGEYTYKGPITNSNGDQINRSDFTAYQDGDTGYICSESGYAYKLAPDYHSWTEITLKGSSALNGKESPTILKVGSTYYWLWSNKSGWRSNDNGYATAPSIAGPWTNRGLFAPSGMFTWDSQCTFVLPIEGTEGTTYLYWGDRWIYKDNAMATHVWQPLTVSGDTVSISKYYPSWNIDIAKGTWSGTGSANLALGKTVSSDSSLSTSPASNGNDGDAASTLWCAEDTSAGHWWKVDLGSNYNITNTLVTWEKPNLSYKYKIEVSTDDSNWVTKVDKTKVSTRMQTQIDNFTANARYVRITVTGMPSNSSASFYEFRVLGY